MFYCIRAYAIENVLSSTLLSIDEWCHTQTTFKCLGKVALIGDANLQCHMSERQVGLFEEPLSDCNALTQDKLMGTLSCRLTEETGEMVGAEPNLLCEHL